ncbi:very short patch repair endonuclease [Mycolicibacterium elephantis]|uniref:Fis family transcriptional regulator n=1 Tax=Mycolicibacterium elephantis DSM 44368 TaxID=1335622 RepID=A0A439DM27_9MYCO|nr:very short patch repair endonuclease [Mycolicibacterium elephantis]MCV7220104.1 very short patch repair endonuclease [Mycolicibacterium elephantis]RWA15892.1 Fis family transcriptional regulator [Mycolicibacterium elephantis DSM 44368]
MTDVGEAGWVKTDWSGQLGGRRSKDTKPEVLLRRELHRLGARFRLHRRLAKGCVPDIVLPRRRLAVFVDGDFWHGCPRHCPNRNPKGPNAAMWQAKFSATRERDARATAIAQEQGWIVVRLWECEVIENPAAAARRVLDASE